MDSNGSSRPHGTAGRPLDLDHRIVEALVAGGSFESCARHAGCSYRTLKRRLRDPRFRARVDEARNTLIRRTVDRLSAYALAAADTLHELLGSNNELVRLGSARTLLEAAAHARLTQELTERVAALESGGPAPIPPNRLVG
jgi:hypothetical protein